MMDSQLHIASVLLDIEAVKLQPDKPFTWASGWKSPIYCDNRKTLSYPAARKTIQDEFARQIRDKYPDTEVIAGVATGAIALGVLVAQELNLPFIYVRSSAKKHGLGNQVEGAWTPGQKVVIIEDLVSTGGSSLAAAQALKEAGLEISGMMAIFTYGFTIARENFKKAEIELTTLSDYSTLIQQAANSDFISQEHVNILEEWRKAPSKWGVK
ncbi:MAG: orotate phosphoribosyltransferase [Bacteroidetes bacterium]|jgi:orotate phosphoribosyltransferase|nr:orotate phosphoribosyltransferase [Bacteroidota bacterium]MBT4400191.1 orotate phosphoribosyltransferase [Bacteroidota bacterium]MBT4408776.1 orotate phosphoribosyltransferase [Bacteroidota bacterium]MBT5426149.1 orotate phosphoribosyltransferase [Bacteroidota bacterium]MBT7092897.1 orotate phosphoribosyltransferase [Bacteroidota bacterium]